MSGQVPSGVSAQIVDAWLWLAVETDDLEEKRRTLHAGLWLHLENGAASFWHCPFTLPTLRPCDRMHQVLAHRDPNCGQIGLRDGERHEGQVHPRDCCPIVGAASRM